MSKENRGRVLQNPVPASHREVSSQQVFENRGRVLQNPVPASHREVSRQFGKTKSAKSERGVA
jgi:hypothetical protein